MSTHTISVNSSSPGAARPLVAWQGGYVIAYVLLRAYELLLPGGDVAYPGILLSPAIAALFCIRVGGGRVLGATLVGAFALNLIGESLRGTDHLRAAVNAVWPVVVAGVAALTMTPLERRAQYSGTPIQRAILVGATALTAGISGASVGFGMAWVLGIEVALVPLATTAVCGLLVALPFGLELHYLGPRAVVKDILSTPKNWISLLGFIAWASASLGWVPFPLLMMGLSHFLLAILASKPTSHAGMFGAGLGLGTALLLNFDQIQQRIGGGTASFSLILFVSSMALVLGGALTSVLAQTRRAFQSLAESKQQLERVYVETPALLVNMTEDGTIRNVSTQFCAKLKYGAHELVGRSIFDHIPEAWRAEFALNMIQIVTSHSVVSFDSYLTSKTGELLEVRLSGAAASLSTPSNACLLFNLEDHTSHNDVRRQLTSLRVTDHATGMPNIQGLKKFLTAAINLSTPLRDFAVVAFSVNQFHQIAGAYGLDAGEELLKIVAARISGQLRGNDYAAKGVHDEILVILPGLTSPVEAEKVINRILDKLSEPLGLSAVPGGPVHISASAGVARHPQDGPDPDTLLRNVELALTRAKTAGPYYIEFFEEHLGIAATSKIILERKLREGLLRDEFLLHYQPRVSTQTGHIIGVEGLMRWKPEGEPLVYPRQVLPAASEAQLMPQLAKATLLKACVQMSEWLRMRFNLKTVSVNVAASDLWDSSFIASVEDALAAAGLHGSYLELEIPEDALLQVPYDAKSRLQLLRALGVNLTLSSRGVADALLNYARRYPFTGINFDKTVVWMGLTDDASSEALAGFIAAGHAAGLTVTAEGVETEEQAELLAQMGADVLQGYYFGKPSAPALLTPVLAKTRGVLRPVVV